MIIQTRKSILLRIGEFTKDHDCPYANRINRMSRSLGTTVHLSLLLEQLDKMHDDDGCPVTHIAGAPTHEWSDWIDDTSA